MSLFTEKSISFTKMSGHGNDFIVIDNSQGDRTMEWKKCAQKWCRRRTGVGADGLLLIEQSDIADFNLRIFNADGSEAEMCGNGARCAAAFAFDRKIASHQMRFGTVAGIIKASVDGIDVSIKMTDPGQVREDIKLNIEGKDLSVCSINTGVPHTILFTDDIEHIPVGGIGQKVRFHQEFEPEGTNVDFVEIIGPGKIRVRTYERGVEAETLACGTGAAASVIVCAMCKDIGDPPIDVVMPGGTLIVDFQRQGDRFRDVWLKGKVDWVYRGEIIEER
ncbi:MAG: diaminopimelate epimerase [Thermodesulfobacteriota bacterium]|nr:diaminopimelate epimerase [Thermodesulfobacteriota bacterium]